MRRSQRNRRTVCYKECSISSTEDEIIQTKQIIDNFLILEIKNAFQFNHGIKVTEEMAKFIANFSNKHKWNEEEAGDPF